ncbi:MAG: hypothetical protein WA902_21165, partial [Thermosynechococcaceae cyanobacterium]
PKTDPNTPPAPDPSQCEIDGGCNADLFKGQGKTRDENYQNLQYMQLALEALINERLDVIDNKLGPQITDTAGNKIGITGRLNQVWNKIQRIGKSMHLDRVMAALTLWVTLHNALMLSRNLGQTLMEVISNGLGAIGIKDEEGQLIDISAIVGSTIEDLLKGVVGADNYVELTTQFKRANRIYQASANVVNSIQSIGYSILSALEVVGSWIARIGNALRKFGVVTENAYGAMNVSPNFQNKYFTAIEKTEELLEKVDTISGEVLSIQETTTQLTEQTTEIDNALANNPPGTQIVNEPIAAALATDKAASQSAAIAVESLVKPEG